MKRCPLLNKDCIQDKCAWWSSFTLRDIASQSITIEHDCLVSRIPGMLIELIRAGDGTAAAVESRGNETIHHQRMLVEMFRQGLSGAARKVLPE